MAAQNESIGWAGPERPEQSGLRVEAGQSMAVAPDPQKTQSIFDDRSGARTDSCSCGPVEGVLSCLAVDAVERVNGANPQDSFAILIDAIHHRPAQAVGVAGLVFEFLKKRRTGGKPVGRHHVQARPNASLAILKQGCHIVFAETIRARGVITVADELPPLPGKFDKAIAKRPKPQSTVPVFQHRRSPGQECVRKGTLMERIMSERIRLSIDDHQPASCDLGYPEHADPPLIEPRLPHL